MVHVASVGLGTLGGVAAQIVGLMGSGGMGDLGRSHAPGRSPVLRLGDLSSQPCKNVIPLKLNNPLWILLSFILIRRLASHLCNSFAMALLAIELRGAKLTLLGQRKSFLANGSRKVWRQDDGV